MYYQTDDAQIIPGKLSKYNGAVDSLTPRGRRKDIRSYAIEYMI